MEYVIMVGQLMLSLSILIVLHEMGHFFPARWFKTRVEKFYLFFDPWFSVFKVKKGDTEYGIGWLPLGGYVKISGMIDESMDKAQMAGPPQPWEFRAKPAWQRLIIMLGGVTVNFILGFLIYAMVLAVWGEQYLPNTNVKDGIAVDSLGMALGLRDGDHILAVGEQPFETFSAGTIKRELALNDVRSLRVRRDGQEISLSISDSVAQSLMSYANKNMSLIAPRVPFIVEMIADDAPAKGTGLQQGDQIIGLAGEALPYFHQFAAVSTAHKGETVELLWLRGSDTLRHPITISAEGRIGVAARSYLNLLGTERQTYSIAEALPAGFAKGVGVLGDQFKAFGQMFRGKIKASESLGGFASIGGLFGTEWIWERFWTMTALISLILAFMNLLPIPALDGGHVVFLLYEVVSGRKPSDKFMEYATIVGFVLVLSLVLFANGLDIWRAVTGG